MSARKPLRRAAAVAAVVAAVAGATAVIGSAGDAEPGARSPILSSEARNHSEDQLSERLVERLGVLRTPRGEEDRLPQDAVTVSARYGSIPTAARRARETELGPLYVIPAEDEKVCLMEANGAGSCTFLERVEQGALIVTADHLPRLARGEVRIFGLVPDGVESVVVALRDGSHRELRVANNVFVATLRGEPDTLRWRGDDPRAVDVPWAR